MALFNDYLLPFDSYGLIVSDFELNLVAILLLSGYAAFAFGYRRIIPQGWIDGLVSEAGGLGDGQAFFAQRFLGLTSAFFFVILIFFFSETLALVLSGYGEKIEARHDSPVYSFFYNLFLILFVAFSVTTVLYSKKYHAFSVVVTVGLLALSLITFSKEPMVYAALFLLSVGARIFQTKQVTFLFIAIGAASLVLVFIVPAFSAYRSTGELMLNNPSGLPMAYLFSDASGPFSSIILAIRNQAGGNLGPLYESFALWVPRSIWSDRPLDAAEAYARAVMRDWRPGFGLGFSPFAEAMIRYGAVFAPFFFLLMGLFMAAVQRIVASRLPLKMIIGPIFVVQSYALFTAYRGAFSGLVTGMIQFWLPFLAIVFAFGFARKLSGSHTRSIESLP